MQPAGVLARARCLLQTQGERVLKAQGRSRAWLSEALKGKRLRAGALRTLTPGPKEERSGSRGERPEVSRK